MQGLILTLVSIHVVNQGLEKGLREFQFMDGYKFVVAEVRLLIQLSRVGLTSPTHPAANLVARHAGLQALPVPVLGNGEGLCSPSGGRRPAVPQRFGRVGEPAGERERVSSAPGHSQEPRAAQLQLEGALQVSQDEAGRRGESSPSLSLLCSSPRVTFLLQLARIKQAHGIDAFGRAVQAFEKVHDRSSWFYGVLADSPLYRALPATKYTDDPARHVEGFGDTEALVRLFDERSPLQALAEACG